jgi:hypothetical protein
MFLNPTNGSWWMLQIISKPQDSPIPFLNPTNGSWWMLQILISVHHWTSDLNNPPTAVGGIPEILS